MEISKLKDQGLLIKTKSGNLAINPAVKAGKLPAELSGCDFILSSDPELNLDKLEDKRVFSWPGEYEIKGIAVHARPVSIYNNNQKSPLLFVIFSDEEKCCYIPEITEKLSSELIEVIGDVDVLMFPAHGDEKLWHSTIEEIEPKAILPIFSEKSLVSAEAFLSKAGLVKPAEQDKVVIKSRSALEGDHMSVFLLA
jgi:hypothetical protein